MRSLRAFLLLLAFVGGLSLGSRAEGAGSSDEGVQVRRYALIVGVNDGGPERVQLRYAATDALALSRVLTQLGGVDPDDAVVLLDADKDGLSAGLDRLAVQLAAASPDVRSELFFYYSGHSDERGLLLGGERVPYKDLREALNALPADVRIGVLDSCASGAFTRTKGGTRTSPFLVDQSGDVSGHAFLTSSSEDEASQESDRLQGSFFTYALISGLRGAADNTGDGRVSLTEVYQFAFHETLRRTESTMGGPQHPAYDIQLAGSGDLVLTDLRQVSASLVLDDALDGRISIRNGDGKLEVELRKFAGRDVTLGLEPGAYTVIWDDGARLREAALMLGRGTAMLLRADDFTSVAREVARARGDAGADPDEPIIGQADVHHVVPRRPGYRRVPFNVSLFPPLDINTFARGPDLNHVSLGLIASRSHVVEGISASMGLNLVLDQMDGVQLGFINVAGGLKGVQSGFVNVSMGGEGLQVGVVNVAEEHRGVMIGLVNIARDADVAIGLLNFVKRGIFHVDVWASDAALVNLGVKFGARHTYTLLHGSFDPIGDAHGGVGLGVGMRLPPAGVAVMDLDVVSSLVYGVNSDEEKAWRTPAFHHRLRVLVNLRFAPHFGMFFGPTLNVLVSAPDRDPATGELQPWSNPTSFRMRDNGSGISVIPAAGGETRGDARVQAWPGLVLGISF